MMHVLPTLYKVGKSGSTFQWTIHTDGPEIVTTHGMVNGAMQVTRKLAVGKNIGKSNETTPEAQAILEAESTWKKKLDANYSLDPLVTKDQAAHLLPMLAHSWKDKKHLWINESGEFIHPVIVQPKLNGVRCLIYRSKDTGEVVLQSRKGKFYSVPHVKAFFESVIPDGSPLVLDGELYSHGMSFQEISRLVKKTRPESVKISFFMYDLGDTDTTSSFHRQKRLENLYEQWVPTRVVPGPVNPPLKIVDSVPVKTESELKAIHDGFKDRGYEGAIVRVLHTPYTFGERSSGLLKYKTFLDAEYKVVGFETGVGKYDGQVLWICQTSDGKLFTVTPKGSFEERKEIYEKAQEYVGKFLTVQYQELSEDGIPIFPVGLHFRDMEYDS